MLLSTGPFINRQNYLATHLSTFTDWSCVEPPKSTNSSWPISACREGQKAPQRGRWRLLSLCAFRCKPAGNSLGNGGKRDYQALGSSTSAAHVSTFNLPHPEGRVLATLLLERHIEICGETNGSIRTRLTESGKRICCLCEPPPGELGLCSLLSRVLLSVAATAAQHRFAVRPCRSNHHFESGYAVD